MPSMVEAKDIVITGGIFNQNNHSDSKSDFQKYIAKNAFHNSQKRSEEANLRNVNNIAHQWTARLRRMSIPSDSLFDALVVEDVIKDIFIWLHDPSTHSLAMWVYDDDRSLTSLIGQVVAEILAKRKELAATYFFPRERVTDTGTDASLVVPTIAYQLVQNIPEVEVCITHTLARHVSISDLKVQDQVAKLVIEPLRHASESLEQLPQRASANVIVVHALEDCDNTDFQMTFLEEFLHGLASIEAIPHSQRLILLGRPTDHLRECFSKLPLERILQRPVHIQRWRTREQDIDRREEKLRKGEEELCKKLDDVKQEQEAAQKAWKIRLQAKKVEEEVRQREGRLIQKEEAFKQREESLCQQEEEFRQRQNKLRRGEELFLQREAAVDGREKDLEKTMREVEKKAEEARLREGVIEQKEVQISDKEKELSLKAEEFSQREKGLLQREMASSAEIRKMKDLQKREQWKGENERKRRMLDERRAVDIEKKELGQILVTGNSHARKTSLVRSIYPKDAYGDAASSANIEHEYTSTSIVDTLLDLIKLSTSIRRPFHARSVAFVRILWKLDQELDSSNFAGRHELMEVMLKLTDILQSVQKGIAKGIILENRPYSAHTNALNDLLVETEQCSNRLGLEWATKSIEFRAAVETDIYHRMSLTFARLFI